MAAVTSEGTAVKRVDGRAEDALRPVRIGTGALKFAEGSALIELGDTRVLVAASIEKRVCTVQTSASASGRSGNPITAHL